MCFQLLNVGSAFLVLFQTFVDEVFAVLTHPVSFRECHIFIHNFIELVSIWNLERAFTAHQLIRQDAQSPDIALLVVLLSQYQLRRQVKRSATDCVPHTILAIGWPAEVCKLDHVVAQQNVLGLDVSMDDVVEVQVIKTVCHLVDQLYRVLDCCSSLSLHQRVQTFVRTQL